MKQGQVVDINRFYPDGDIDWPRVKENFIAVGICAVYGSKVDSGLVRHVDKCVEYDLPYWTYGIPDRWKDSIWWADMYMDQYGVEGHPTTLDAEPTNGYMATPSQFYNARNRIERSNGMMPWWYSNYYYTTKLDVPEWILEDDMIIWWAEYPEPHRYFHTFLAKFPWWNPRWAEELGYRPVLHQFTSNGDAPYYLTNGAKLSADLNVTLVDADAFLALFPGHSPSTEQKVDILWEAHPELHS